MRIENVIKVGERELARIDRDREKYLSLVRKHDAKLREEPTRKEREKRIYLLGYNTGRQCTVNTSALTIVRMVSMLKFFPKIKLLKEIEALVYKAGRDINKKKVSG